METQLRSSINCPNKIEIFYRLVNGFKNCFMLYSFLNVFIMLIIKNMKEKKLKSCSIKKKIACLNITGTEIFFFIRIV